MKKAPVATDYTEGDELLDSSDPMNVLLLDDDDLIIEIMQKYVEVVARSYDVKADHFNA